MMNKGFLPEITPSQKIPKSQTMRADVQSESSNDTKKKSNFLSNIFGRSNTTLEKMKPPSSEPAQSRKPATSKPPSIKTVQENQKESDYDSEVPSEE